MFKYVIMRKCISQPPNRECRQSPQTHRIASMRNEAKKGRQTKRNIRAKTNNIISSRNNSLVLFICNRPIDYAQINYSNNVPPR